MQARHMYTNRSTRQWVRPVRISYIPVNAPDFCYYEKDMLRHRGAGASRSDIGDLYRDRSRAPLHRRREQRGERDALGDPLFCRMILHGRNTR